MSILNKLETKHRKRVEELERFNELEDKSI